MAYFKIETDRKGRLKARIQVSGKDYATGKAKNFTKKVYLVKILNKTGLTEQNLEQAIVVLNK